MLFDASQYLKKLEPAQKYSTEVLSGGLNNVTVRARKQNVLIESPFPGYSTFVLKFAPPFVAAKGNSVPITTYRQTIEARALSLFDPDNDHSIHEIASRSHIKIPTLLYHDTEEHVLIMSDIGSVTSLQESFSDLGGYGLSAQVPPLKHKSEDEISGVTNENTTKLWEMVGYRYGSFFARLHSPGTLAKFLDHPDRDSEFMKNPFLGNFTFEIGIKPILDNLKSFPQYLGSDEAIDLYGRIVTDIMESTSEQEQSLILADCWPGSLLVSSEVRDVDHDLTTAVVDWEFARIGRGLNTDIALLLAHFALFQTAAQCRQEMFYEKEIALIASATIRAYREVSVNEDAKWIKRSTFGPSRWPDLQPDTLRAKMLRSAFLIHGAEIMRCCFGKEWRCRDPRCMDGGSHVIAKHKCSMVQAMVERAIWYFRHAGIDVNSFCSEGNVKVLREAKHQGRWLMELF